MKKIVLSVSAFMLTMNLMAQAPQKMSYQAVVRNSSNALVQNGSIGMRISILQGSASGTAVYVETQTPTTNNNGLASVTIGSGTVVSGDMSTIDWSTGDYFLQTETDPTGGTNYTVIGTSQLLSVPYALHAKTAESVLNDQVNDADADPTNELQNWSNLPGIPTDFSDNVDNVDDADADPNNEIELPAGGTNAQVLSTDGSGNYTWVDQPANELPVGGNNAQVLSTDGAGTYSWVDQPANELPVGGNNAQVLSTDGSGNYSWVDQTVNNLPNGTAVGQTAYWNGSAWVVNTNIFNNGGNVGVGTATPASKLTVNGNIQVNNSNVPSGIAMENTGGNAPVANFDVNFRSTGYNTTYKGGSVRVDGRTATPTIQFLTRPAGSTSETIAMAISESNNVGIGTSAPGSLLSVGSASNTAVSPAHVTQVSGNSMETMALQGNTAGTNLSFYKQGSTVRQAAVQSQVNSSGSDMNLYTTSTSGTADQVRMTIKADGNVGIGTTLPSERLDVIGNMKFTGALMPANTAGTAGQVLTSAGAGTAPTWTTPAAVTNIYNSDGSLTGNRVVTQGANTLAFTGTAVNAFNVDAGTFSVDAANNRVGVLTTSPAAQFSVGGASNVSVVPGHVTQISGNNIETMALQGSTIATNLSFYKQGSTTRQAAVQSSVNALGSDLAFYTTSSTGTADQNRMIIKADGNVGIGTATPNAPLQFANTLANRKIVLWEDANNDHEYYGIGINGSMMRYQSHGVNGHAFYNGTSATTSTELMRILANGNVGIGTASPTSKLEVAGTANLNGTLFLTTGNLLSTNTFPVGNGAIANVIFYTACAAPDIAAVLFIDNTGIVKVLSQAGTGGNNISGSGTNTITLNNGCGTAIPYVFSVSGGNVTISYPTGFTTSAKWVVTPN